MLNEFDDRDPRPDRRADLTRRESNEHHGVDDFVRFETDLGQGARRQLRQGDETRESEPES